MRLIKATEKDNEDLKSFLSEQVVSGLYDYTIERPNSFFDQYKLSTDDYHTYILRDGENKIQASASLLFKKGYVDHQEQSIGYVTDLRVAPTRAATLTWAKEFMPQFEILKNERQAQFVFSELEQYESKAYNMLLRRRNRSTKMPRYHLFRKFFLTVIYGRKLLAPSPLSAIKITHGRTEDLEEISLYLQEKAVRRPLRYLLDTQELERRCRTWPNFSLQNFLIARNPSGEIIGCMAPWNNRDVQKVKVVRYRSRSQKVFNTSRSLSLLGLTRPLPKLGENFSVKHLTHLSFDNPDIFYSLLNHAYNECQNKEVLVYPNYVGEYSMRPSKSFFSVKIPYGFYSLMDDEDKLPAHLHPNPFKPAPDFAISHF